MPNIENFWKEIKVQIDDSARRRVERVCDETGQSMPVVIAQLGLAPDDVVVAAYEEAFGLDQVNLDQLADQNNLGEFLNPAFLKTRLRLDLVLAGLRKTT